MWGMPEHANTQEVAEIQKSLNEAARAAVDNNPDRFWQLFGEKQAKWPEIGPEVNSHLKVFWAKIEGGKLYLKNGVQIPINWNTKSIDMVPWSFFQEKRLDWNASVRIQVTNNDWSAPQYADFTKWPDWDKLVFEKNWVKTPWYTIRRESQSQYSADIWNQREPDWKSALKQIREDNAKVAKLLSEWNSQSFWQNVIWDALKNPDTIKSFINVLNMTDENKLFNTQEWSQLADVLTTQYKSLPPELKSKFEDRIKNFAIRNIPGNDPRQKLIENRNYKVNSWSMDNWKMAMIITFSNWQWLPSLPVYNKSSIPRAR